MHSGATGDRHGCAGFRRMGHTRREALAAGALGLAGFGLPALLRAQDQTSTGAAVKNPHAGFGRAKQCLIIFMWGGPSQLDTWDPKPAAPAEIRGPFASIATRTPGLRVGEHFPMLAQETHRLAVIHSMSHDDAAHLSTAHRVFTGHLAPVPNSDAIGPSGRDWPHIGSVLAKIRPAKGTLPTAVTMPWIVSHPAAPGGRAPGQHGGWLGKAYDPFVVEGDPNAADFRVPGLELPAGVSPSRLASRHDLLGRARAVEGASVSGASGGAWQGFQERAIDTLVSAEARGAFAIEREDPRLRDRYGRHIHGQCLLLARRLLEAGVPLVTVNWHDDGHAFWDTHADNFNQLKTRLMPPADQGFSALLEDMAARGRLDDTLIVWVGEFGRAPRIDHGTGRDHWPRCYSAVLAGAGVAGGQVYGASDRWAMYPANNPVSPEDLGATMMHAMGIDPELELPDPLGRMLKINTGTPVTALFG